MLMSVPLLNINLCQGEQSWSEQVYFTMNTKSSRGCIWLMRTRQSFLIQRPHVRGRGARMPTSCAHVHPSA